MNGKGIPIDGINPIDIPTFIKKLKKRRLAKQ